MVKTEAHNQEKFIACCFDAMEKKKHEKIFVCSNVLFTFDLYKYIHVYLYIIRKLRESEIFRKLNDANQ